jgi:hypothetical protein
MFEVAVNDSVNFAEAKQWAVDNCTTFANVIIVDVSDVSMQWDEVAVFNFSSESDAAWFKLKWSESQ